MLAVFLAIIVAIQQGMAWSSYLEYSYSNDIESLNVGNSFLEQPNVVRKDYYNELVRCLEDCKFRYENWKMAQCGNGVLEVYIMMMRKSLL